MRFNNKERRWDGKEGNDGKGLRSLNKEKRCCRGLHGIAARKGYILKNKPQTSPRSVKAMIEGGRCPVDSTQVGKYTPKQPMSEKCTLSDSL